MYIRISIPNACIYSSAVDIGKEVTYVEHLNRSNDSSISVDPMVYEGYLAHEKGHASYDVGPHASQLNDFLAMVERLWRMGVYTFDQAKDKVSLFLVADATNLDASATGAAANSATTSWFENSRQWERIS